MGLRFSVTTTPVRCYYVALSDAYGTCGTGNSGDGHTYGVYVDGTLQTSGTIAGNPFVWEIQSYTDVTTVEVIVGPNADMMCDSFFVTLDVYAGALYE
jgi:hypothetical protein